MIKDLLLHKFSNDSEAPKAYTALRSPRTQPNIHALHNIDNASPTRPTIASLGKPKKNSDKLKFLLINIRFPSSYNE
jgi:hypothetical protein